MTPRFFVIVEGEILLIPIVMATEGLVFRGLLEKSRMSVLSFSLSLLRLIQSQISLMHGGSGEVILIEGQVNWGVIGIDMEA